jgi:hypothetical protein
MSTTTQTTRDRIVAGAQSVPDLIAKASVLDPALAQKFEGKALVASKTLWGTLIGMGVSWLVTKYALNWDATTSAYVTGAITMGITGALRTVTDSPITGLLKKSPPVTTPPSAA